MIINNGANIPLDENTGNMPNVSGALMNWFQPMVFGIVSKSTVAFDAKETMTEINFLGVIQPYSPRQLELLPEGQRSRSWFMVHSQINLHLENDDVITYLNKQYRVMSQNEYNLNGYYEYRIQTDWTGSGPTVVP